MATTSHYGFTLFEGSDRPTWLTDWNNTITAIDNALYRIATGGGDLPDLTEVVARLQALEGRVDSDELRLNVVEGDIVDILSSLSTVSSDLSALATHVTTAESDIDTLETAVNTTLPSQIQSINDSITGILSSISSMTSDISGLDTRLTTAEGNISTNTSDISNLDTRVTTLETSGGSVPALEARVTTAEGNIATNTSDISALDTRVTSAEGNISTNSTAISGLDTRVTALETSGGSGVTIEDKGVITSFTPTSIRQLFTSGYNLVIVTGGSYLLSSNTPQPLTPSILTQSDFSASYPPLNLCYAGNAIVYKASSASSQYYTVSTVSLRNEAHVIAIRF